VALVNASALLVVTIVVLLEAIRRLIHGTPEINGLPVLIVSAVGAVVMVAGALVLGSDAGGEDLHMRSVLLDTVSDALTSAAVAVTGGIMYLAHGLYWLDSVVAILIGLVVGAGAVGLLRDVLQALRTPRALEAPAQAPAAATRTSHATAPDGAES
jgi:cobalt-zinc-cadmium efflux system protein